MTLHIPNLSSDSRTDTTSRTLRTPADVGLYRRVLKRPLDLTLVLLSAPVVLPLIAVLAVLVALLTGSRPFYSQLRVGRHGKPFRMWKLRTMVVNAEAHLEHYLQQNPAARVEWDSTQKLKNDPRITAVGRLLRKTSIDELPQLFNVFNGTMSLVGPRPMMVGQEKYYHGGAYYEMRPGITGLWQVSDRNDCDFADRVAFDTKYSSDLSLKTDLALLFRTVGVVMRATGH
jgi:lipopolysaccharide/colanic/teichoic acid biosynthesis glycosyltransferase